MSSWNKQVSFKNLAIGIAASAAMLFGAAYYAGIKEVATPEGVIFALLLVLFLIMCLRHYEIRRRKEAGLFEELRKRRQESDK